MDDMSKYSVYPKRSKASQEVNEKLVDHDYLTTDFIDNEESNTGATFDELPTSTMGNLEGNPDHDIENVLHDEDLPTFVDNSAYNTNTNSFYLSPVQCKPITGKKDYTIDHTKPQTQTPPRPIPADGQRHIPEYLELEEFPTQANMQTSDTQTSNSTTENADATGKSTKRQEKSDAGMDAYSNKDLDDDEYLRTDFTKNEPSNPAPECSGQELPSSTGKQCLRDEELLNTAVDISSCKMLNLQVILSPIQHKPTTGNTDHTIDQTNPQTPPSPPPDRQPGESMYEEIPEIPEYLELEEVPTQVAVQTPDIQNLTQQHQQRQQTQGAESVLRCWLLLAC